MVERSEPFLPGFTGRPVPVPGPDGDLHLHAAVGGSGPPVLLLHGYPQTHVSWRAVAPILARRFTVVAPDLRGYGDSAKPPGGPDHAGYSKRAMAADAVALMARLGFDRFAVIGHDRGGRVAHRMALDHPGVVDRVAVLDIAPTATMYARTDKAFASRYWWWFFLIQPAPLPERLMAADPAFFLRQFLGQQDGLEEAVFAEYLRCFRDPATRHAMCEDYRAAAGIDLKHDAADADARVTTPLLALWGDKGVVGRTYDVLETWREKATNVRGHALPCGHNLQEERPAEVAAALEEFLS